MRYLAFYEFPFAEPDRLPMELGSGLIARAISHYEGLGEAETAGVQPGSAIGQGWCHFHLVSEFDDKTSDDVFFEYLTALRLIRPLPFFVESSFSFDKDGLKSLSRYHLSTRCNSPSFIDDGGCIIREYVTPKNLECAGHLLSKINTVHQDKAQEKLAAAIVAFAQVSLGSVAAYQPAFVSLLGALDVLTGGECREAELPPRVTKILGDQSAGLLDFLRKCCKQRGHLAHGKPVDRSPDLTDSNSRHESLVALHDVVRRVVLRLLGMDGTARMQFLGLRGNSWRGFDAQGMAMIGRG